MVGHVAGVKLGDVFKTRMELAVAYVHNSPDAGIDPQNNDSEQAYAVCLNGTYKDDEDGGATGLWYTGRGVIKQWG